MTKNKLCTKADVKRFINTVGRWNDVQIDTEIENVTEDIYEECGDPITTVKSYIGYNTQTNEFYREYVLGDTRIYDVDRVFVGTLTKRELSSVTDFDIGRDVGMIRLTSGNPGGKALDKSDEILVQYIPGIYSRYCAIRVAESLLSSVNIMDTGGSSKELTRILGIKEKIEEKLNRRLGIQFSSRYKYFDEVYSVVKKIRQKHDFNKYLWKSD